MFCQKCGKEVQRGDFCDHCGNNLTMPSVICYCANCGAAIDDGATVCNECGAEIKGIEQKQPSTLYGRGRVIHGTTEDIKPDERKKTNPKKIITSVIIGIVVIAAAAAGMMYAGGMFGAGKETDTIAGKTAVAPEDVYTIGGPLKIMTKCYNVDSASGSSPVVQRLEDIIGSELEIEWVQEKNYGPKVSGVIGSGKYPHVMLVTSVEPVFMQAIKSDMFWDISDVFSDEEKYPYLSQANADVNHNISIDGKIYGLYRARIIGRAGVSVRKDWLDKLGLKTPQTVDEFSEMLRQFTENDPDGNGMNDTYGMIITDYLSGPLENLAVWCGAPNGWGKDDNGELKPSFMFDEYTEALRLMRDWYSKGYINSDMETYSSSKWNERFLNGQAGVIIDVADRARRLAMNMADINPDAEVDVFGYVKKDDASEAVTLPTSGYDGYYVFPKAAIKTREDLEYVLTVMDKLNSKEAVNLMNYGIEGTHYTKDSSGYITISSDENLKKDYRDLNQLSMGIVDFSDSLKTRYNVAVADKVEEVYKDNEKYALYNPAEPYVSSTYSKKSTQLDAIMDEAKLNFILGRISEEEYNKEIERWKNDGGNSVIREINEEYRKDSSIK